MTSPAQTTGGPRPAATVSYLIADSALGIVLIAATARGICAILPGEDRDRLVGELHHRFPGAEPSAGDPRLQDLARRVLRLVAGQAEQDLPLDPRGTGFERRVWDAVAGIPAGSVTSYADLASRMGAVGSARAVARACAANSIAIAIPCHRVVRSDGGPGGYRWGVRRKRKLLAREAAA